MCGITGITSKKRNNIGEILVKCGHFLTYRGYDSVGLVALDNGKVELRKDVGTIEDVDKRLKLSEMKGQKGIIQLRWATYGPPSQQNAQPHIGCDDYFFGAHNGNIHNFLEYREQLIKEGHILRSMNDGELCVHAVEKFYRQTKDMIEAVRLSTKELKGAYAYIVGKKDDDKLYAVKMGSSLVVGIGDNETIVSSDLPSILPVTRNVIFLKDGEMVELTPTNVVVYDIETGNVIEKEITKVDLTPDIAKKGGYPHFMLKEIYEQVDVAKDLTGYLTVSDHSKVIETLMNADNIYFVACGSSYNAAVVGSYYFNKLAKTPVYLAIGGQFEELYGNTITDKSAIVLISQSGETKDVINVLNLAKKQRKGKTIGIVNVVGSTLMLSVDHYIPMYAGYEISVPATKTYTAQIIILLYLALELAKMKKAISDEEYMKIKNEFMKIPELIKQTIESVETHARYVADTLIDEDDLYSLGYGLTDGVAREGALKIKEICYIHCEGMYSSEFKHGPLSIVSDNYPIIYTVPPDNVDMMINHINEVLCRDGRPIIIAEPHESLRKYVKNEYDFITVPKSNLWISPILQTIPLQLIAYYLSTKKGIDPDRPRNLSKTLTVD